MSFAGAALPRSLERWERRIGVGSRLEIQLAQTAEYGLHAVRQACILMDGSPLLLERGLVALEARIQFLQIDVGEKLDQLQEMETELARYRSLFKKSPIGFHTLSPEGRIIEVNDRWCELLGYEKREVVGRSIFEFIVDEQVENATARFEERLRGVPEEELTPRNAIRQYKRKDGEVIYVETQDTVFRNQKGMPLMVQTSFRDITARIRAEEALIKAHEAMIQQEREAAVGQMAAAVSHKYKNQIVVIAGLIWKLGELFSSQRVLLEAIREGRLHSEAEEWTRLRELEEAIDRVRGLLEEYVQRMDATTRGFLSFSRPADEEKIIVGVRGEIERYILPLTVITNHQGAELKISFHRVEENDGVLISASGLQDVIRNLVANSIEAGAKEIHLIVAKTAKGWIKISVQDDGSGIEPRLLSQLLHGPVKSLKPGGTGLGLSLVKKVIASAEGDVFVRSRVGRGTWVVIELPRVEYTPPVRKTERAEPVSQIDSQTASKLTVYVIDDEFVHCELLSERLGQLGYQVTSFQDPLAALRAYQGAAQKPHIVITDQTMPALSGTELIERIAATGRQALPQFAIYSGDMEIEQPEHPVRQRVDRYDVVYIVKTASFERLRQKMQEMALRALAAISS